MRDTLAGASGGSVAAEPEPPLFEDVRPLVTRARSGDRRAMEELYLLHFDRIYNYLVVTVGNRQDAEDLAIQTFVRMIESIGRFEVQTAPFASWLFRIARNLAIDHFRGLQRRPPGDPMDEHDLDFREPSAEDEAMRAFARRGMLELIKSLPREQQQVLTLKFLFSFSNAEAALIMEKSEGAVKALQHRALASLQRQAIPRAA